MKQGQVPLAIIIVFLAVLGALVILVDGLTLTVRGVQALVAKNRVRQDIKKERDHETQQG